MDIKSPEERSKNMAAIHSKNTKPEIYLRKLLFARGYRYGVNSKSVPGHPDIYMKKYNTAIFVHGCFWHAHDCHLHRLPSTRPDFWLSKLAGNRVRDADALTELHEDGWRTCIVWECALRGKTRIGPDRVTGLITTWLSSSIKHTEIRGAS